MKKGLPAALLMVLAGTPAALAQTSTPLPPAPAPFAAPPATPVVTSPAGTGWAASPTDGGSPVGWISAEYLNWWLKGAPLAVPITTTGSRPDRPVGALGQPHTQVTSPSTLDFGPFGGGRATAGAWLDGDRTLGFEASGFLLETRSSLFSATSPPGGVGPRVFVPFISSFGTFPPVESAFPLGAGGATSGLVAVSNRTRLWGGEGNALLNLFSNDCLCLTGLVGFRYLDLTENLQIESLGTAPGGTLTSFDSFGTRNQFWGGQVGVRGEARMGSFFVNLSGRVGLGDMHESVNVNGVSFLVTPTIRPTVPGGFFALPSNSVRNTSDRFAVVPDVRAQVGYDLSRNVRLFVGYEFLYASDVVRPGDQIDRRINFDRQAAPVGNGGFTGPLVPAPQFNHTDFWAHGVSLGVALRF